MNNYQLAVFVTIARKLSIMTRTLDMDRVLIGRAAKAELFKQAKQQAKAN